MTASVRLDHAALDRYVNDPNGDVAKDLSRRAIRVHRETVRLVHLPGHGRVYRKSNPKRVHQASAPGAPPATDLGLLAASYRWALGTDSRGLFAVVGSGLKKARYLELGTRKMAARPVLRRALFSKGRGRR